MSRERLVRSLVDACLARRSRRVTSLGRRCRDSSIARAKRGGSRRTHRPQSTRRRRSAWWRPEWPPNTPRSFTVAGPAVQSAQGSAEAKPAGDLHKTTQRVECGPSVVWHAHRGRPAAAGSVARHSARSAKRDDLVKSGGDVVLPRRQHQVDSVQAVAAREVPAKLHRGYDPRDYDPTFQGTYPYP